MLHSSCPQPGSVLPGSEVSSPLRVYELPSATESPEDIAESIEELANSLRIFPLSGLDIAEQATLRVCAFNAWTEVGERECEIQSYMPPYSLDIQYTAHQKLLAFRLRQTEMLEELHRHLGTIKRFFQLLVDNDAMESIPLDDISTAFVMSWILTTGADELRSALDVEVQTEADATFVEAIIHDSRKSKWLETNMLGVIDEGQLRFNEIYLELIDFFCKKRADSTKQIAKPLERRHYTLSELVEHAADQFPLLRDIEKASLQLQQPSKQSTTTILYDPCSLTSSTQKLSDIEAHPQGPQGNISPAHYSQHIPSSGTAPYRGEKKGNPDVESMHIDPPSSYLHPFREITTPGELPSPWQPLYYRQRISSSVILPSFNIPPYFGEETGNQSIPVGLPNTYLRPFGVSIPPGESPSIGLPRPNDGHKFSESVSNNQLYQVTNPVYRSGSQDSSTQSRIPLSQKTRINFPCPDCEMVFNRESALNLHILMHTGEKPHKCEVCHAAFMSKSNLKRHMASKKCLTMGQQASSSKPETADGTLGATSSENPPPMYWSKL